MRKSPIILFVNILLSCFLLSFTNKNKKTIAIVKINWYDSILKLNNDTTYVLNFWATWCMPCVAELPVFEKLYQKTKSEKVKIILVSVDNAKQINKTLFPFIKSKKINNEIVLLNEPHANEWINKVDTNWQGSIPATFIFNNKTGYKSFIEKQLNFEELNLLIKKSFVK